MAGIPLGNVILYAVVVFVPSLACWAFLHGRWLSGPFYRLFHRLRPAMPKPTCRPIEAVAADLRRVHRALEELEPGAPMIRRVGTRQAYDTLLVQACVVVGVRHELDTLGDGIDRELERMRVEESLRAAGMAIR